MKVHMTFKHILLGAASIGFIAFPLGASAQSIEVGELGAAQAYDAGVIDFNSGGLDPALWQGTSAKMATHLLNNLPDVPKHPIGKNMIRSVVLTGGVPPQGDDPGYAQARLRSVMALNDPQALQNLASRSPDIVADPAVRADLALAVGEVENACAMADSITEGRSTPTWARLRAVCHVKRGEVPAAELTVSLLKKSGLKDDVFYALMNRLTGVSQSTPDISLSGDPLYAAMADLIAAGAPAPLSAPNYMTPLQAASVARDPKASPDARLQALFKADKLLDNAAMEQILSGMIYDGVPVDALSGASNFTLEQALAAGPSGKSFAQLFALIKQGGDPQITAKAASALLTRAQKAGAFARFSELIEAELAILSPEAKAATDLALFARAAVLRADIGALQSLYAALGERPEDQARLALAADALGNGFRLGDLGRDIETRLGTPAAKRRAERDAYIALALGSTLSGSGAIALEGAGAGAGRALKDGQIAAIGASAKAGSRAETALRAAIALEGRALNGPSLAAVIAALMEAQLPQYAGQIAALDFLEGL
jgi:hypothetical protein